MISEEEIIDPEVDDIIDLAAMMKDLDWSAMSVMEQIAMLPEDERVEVLKDLTEDDLHNYRLWLRPSQLKVLDDKAPIVLDARGRGAGKTRTGATWAIEKARRPGARIHLVGRTVADVRDVMINGESGIMSQSPPDFRPEYMPSVRRIVWPNGSVGMSFSADSPDQLRGPQSDFTWCDEIAAWKMKPDSSGLTAWDNVLLSTRLGPKPQILATTTPRRVRVVRGLIAQARDGTGRVSMHVGSMLENAANLAPEYVRNMLSLYAGTALEQQEIYGIMLDEVAGALWKDSDFIYASFGLDLKDMVTVIGVDPGVTTGGDATGIVVARGTLEKLPSDRRLQVIRDETEEGIGPERVSARIVEIWREETAKCGRPAIVVAEKNQGGEWVSTSIKLTDGGDKVPVALVHAKGSKAGRAEPIVMAYRRSRVFHDKGLDQLEEEMTTWEPEVKDKSPNRLDALVHAARAVLVNDECLRRFGALRVESIATDVTVATPDFRKEDSRARAGLLARHRRGRERA